jgi:hypothetical protein
VRLPNSLKKFSSPGLESRPASPDANQSFTRVVETGRIIREYSGFLPCTQLTARHILRCEHLRDIPGEGLPPYRVEPNYTHQLWIWYRPQQEPGKLYLVFRGQFEFTIPGKDADEVAREVTDFLAYLMLQTGDRRQVLRHEESDLFWADAVETKLESVAYEAS